MEPTYWHNKWEKNDIAFHEDKPNPLIVSHFKALALEANSRVFIPLCGKTLDISWLLSKGYRVAGAELSELAIQNLFKGLGLEPTITQNGAHQHYSAEGIDIFVGDIFALEQETLGPVDAVYDRAALVALPEELRKRYSAHLTTLTNTAPQLVICYDYDQSAMKGPPFSVSNDEVRVHYSKVYTLHLLSSAEAEDPLQARCPAPVQENIWLLQKQ